MNDLTQWELAESPAQRLLREINEDIRWHIYRLNNEQRSRPRDKT
jgi:hypothetical protein